MSQELNFRQIPFGSADYEQACRLRHEVLRAPIGLNLFAEDLSPERQQEHFGSFDPAGQIVACLVAVRLSPEQAKLRQMAVHPARQRQGHGQRILRAVEQHLAASRIRRITLHARTTAAPFYAALGYQSVGEEFTEVGIPHVVMEKALSLSGESDPSFPSGA